MTTGSTDCSAGTSADIDDGLNVFRIWFLLNDCIVVIPDKLQCRWTDIATMWALSLRIFIPMSPRSQSDPACK